MRSTMRRAACLLVEDSPTMARLVQGYLTQIPELQLQIGHVTSLKDAFGTLGTSAFDVVLLDLNLTDSTAVNTITRMSEILGDWSVIVLTESVDPMMEVAAYEAGATDYLRKSHLSPIILRRAVLNALAERDSLRYEELSRRLEDQVEQLLPEPGWPDLPADETHRAELDSLYASLFNSALKDDVFRYENEMVTLTMRLSSWGYGNAEVASVHGRVVDTALQERPRERRQILTRHGYLLSDVMGRVLDLVRSRR